MSQVKAFKCDYCDSVKQARIYGDTDMLELYVEEYSSYNKTEPWCGGIRHVCDTDYLGKYTARLLKEKGKGIKITRRN